MQRQSQSNNRIEESLVFDPNTVTLTGNFKDELSLFRAKRSWIDVLTSSFLLEEKRDYEISLKTDLKTKTFHIDCSFLSACGRYSFWRLINHQAPEAEEKLCPSSNKATNVYNANSIIMPDTPTQTPKEQRWILSFLSNTAQKTKQTSWLLKLLQSLF